MIYRAIRVMVNSLVTLAVLSVIAPSRTAAIVIGTIVLMCLYAYVELISVVFETVQIFSRRRKRP